MDSQEFSPAQFSYGRLLGRFVRQVYTHRLQFYTLVLRFCARGPIALNGLKLIYHFPAHPPSVRPDLWALLLGIATKLIWIYLFRDPAAFLWFRRPTRRYQWAVCATAALTTIPNILVHVWALLSSLGNKYNHYSFIGVWLAITTLVLMVPISALVWWMAWKFLLGDDDNEEDFQLTIKTLEEEGRRFPFSLPSPEVTDGFLHRAYEAQRSISPTPSPVAPPIQAATVFSTGEEGASVGESQRSGQQGLINRQSNAARHARCQTITRFEYMPQSHSGFISWFSYPIIAVQLIVASTIHSVAVLVLLYEDSQYRFRNPQFQLKKGLCFQLGHSLLCFYILKHRWRASLFERFSTSLPRPWSRKTSIFPFSRRSKVFINVETGDITTLDPAQRASSSFPRQGHRGPSSTIARKYIAAYNTNPGTCTTVYGHSGHGMASKLRYLPTICRIGYILLVSCITLEGWLHVKSYHPPLLGYREKFDHPDLTADEMALVSRIHVIGDLFRYSQVFLVHPFTSIVPLLIGANLYLFISVAWKYASEDTKQVFINVLKPYLVKVLFGLEPEGRIRLD